jgi:hypothetical protein
MGFLDIGSCILILGGYFSRTGFPSGDRVSFSLDILMRAAQRWC